jgi:hypothetical protein
MWTRSDCDMDPRQSTINPLRNRVMPMQGWNWSECVTYYFWCPHKMAEIHVSLKCIQTFQSRDNLPGQWGRKCYLPKIRSVFSHMQSFLSPEDPWCHLWSFQTLLSVCRKSSAKRVILKCKLLPKVNLILVQVRFNLSPVFSMLKASLYTSIC